MAAFAKEKNVNNQGEEKADGGPDDAEVERALFGGMKMRVGRCKQNVVLALDKSGSMAGGRMRAVKEGFTKIMECLEDGDNIHVIAFNEEVEDVSQGFQQISAGSKMAISRRVQAIKAEGRTALYETVLKSSKAILELSALAHMAAAAEEGASTGRFTLVVLTDGADTSEDRDEKLEQAMATLHKINEDLGPEGPLAKLLKAADGLLRVMFIGVQLDLEARAPIEFLTSAAGASASYQDVQSTDEIVDVFQEISVSIQRERGLLERLAEAVAEEGGGGGGAAGEGMPFDPDSPIQEGSHVRVVATSRGAGIISIGDIGVVKKRDPDGDYRVCFPEQDNWCARPDDITLDEAADRIRPGQRVKVKSTVGAPKHGWGVIEDRNAVFFVKQVHYDGDVDLFISPEGKKSLHRMTLTELEATDHVSGSAWSGEFQIGQAVRIKAGADEARRGTGIARGSVGYTIGYAPATPLYVVNFPEADEVQIRASHLELCDDANFIRPGMRVKVKRSVDEPVGGWAGVSHDSVGTIVEVRHDGVATVRFRECNQWRGHLRELETAW